MTDEMLEGWFTDPYRRHDARWLSAGEPTKLVRDGDSTSYDDPPPGPWVEQPQRLEPDPTSTGGQDLVRADAAEAAGGEYDKEKAKWAAYDQVAGQPPSAFDDASLD